MEDHLGGGRSPFPTRYEARRVVVLGSGTTGGGKRFQADRYPTT